MVSQPITRRIQAGRNVGALMTIQNDGEIPTQYIVEATGISVSGFVPETTARTITPIISPGDARDVRVSIPIPRDATLGDWDVRVRIYEAGPAGSLGALVDEAFFQNVLEILAPQALVVAPIAAPPAELEEPFLPPAVPVLPPVPTPPTPATVTRAAELAGTPVQRRTIGTLTGALTLTEQQFARLEEIDPFRRVRLRDFSEAQILEFLQTGFLPESEAAIRERLEIERRTAQLQAAFAPVVPLPDELDAEAEARAAAEAERFAAILERRRIEQAAQAVLTQAERQQIQLTLDQAQTSLRNLQSDLAIAVADLDSLNSRTTELAQRIVEHERLGFFQIIPVWWGEFFGTRRPTISEIQALSANLRTEAAEVRRDRNRFMDAIAVAEVRVETAERELRQLSA